MTTINLTKTTEEYDAKAETIKAVKYHFDAIKELLTTYNYITDSPMLLSQTMAEVEATAAFSVYYLTKAGTATN